MSNANLNHARNKNNINDEYYTPYEAIEAELRHYTNLLKDKIIYCNCDNPKFSNFWKYFHINFSKLCLKKLIATYLVKEDEISYKWEYEGGNDENTDFAIKTSLVSNGDFSSEECLSTLTESDLVITNPPFSKFRGFVKKLTDSKKDFLIIGNKNAVTTRELFIPIKDGIVSTGYTIPNNFTIGGESTKKLNGLCRWFTTMPVNKSSEFSGVQYNSSKYKTFDWLPNVINIDRCKDIPTDYDGIMAVPITFLDVYDRTEYEMIDVMNRYAVCDYFNVNESVRKEHSFCTNIGGKPVYKRIAIKKK